MFLVFLVVSLLNIKHKDLEGSSSIIAQSVGVSQLKTDPLSGSVFGWLCFMYYNAAVLRMVSLAHKVWAKRYLL